MRLPRPTKLNQRVLGSAVVGLLAANAFAAAVIAGDVGGSVAAPVTSESTAPPAAAPAPQTVTLITTSDGRRLLVDPSTSAGRQAIADAQREGATTQDVPVPVADRSDEGEGDGPAGSLTGQLGLRRVLGSLPSSGALEVDQDVVDHLLQDPAGTITSVVDGAKTTVSSVLGTVQTTVSSVVGTGQTTVSSLLGSTPSTVTSVVGGTQSTVSSLLDPSPSTSSLLGSLITTVSTVVQSVTPTTSAPSPTTIPLGPLCGLLAHC